MQTIALTCYNYKEVNKMPQVIFKKMSLEDNIKFIKTIINDKNNYIDIYQKTISLFPELTNIKNKSEITEIVTNYYNNNINNLEYDVKKYNKNWNKYNNNFFQELTKYLEIKWPSNHNIIEATVGIIPVCPRYLKNFTFSVHDGIKNEFLIEICAHELCHFLWFEKWKELYPNCPKNEFESPHIPWIYSEMVVDPILNSKNLQKVFDNQKHKYAYDSFYEIEYNNENIMNKLNEIYQSPLSIENKIKTGYQYISNYFNKEKESITKTR